MSDFSIANLYLGPEGTPYHGGHLLRNLLLFGRVCKTVGMDVSPGRMIEVARALEFINLGHKSDFYHALRGLIVTRQADLPIFDEAFALFWKRHAEGWITLDMGSLGQAKHRRRTQFLPPLGATPDDDTEEDEGKPELDPNLIAITPTYSVIESMRYKDFADMSQDEIALAQKAMRRLPKALGFRKSRRFQAGKGAQLDLRRTFRRNMRYMGESIELPTRGPKLKPRPLILICDISGSMERYSRLFLHFIHVLANSMYQVESFLFSTRLTRITHQIRHKSVDMALHEVGLRANDWGGGTRTGEALHQFNYRWARRVLGRGAVVMLISDGWDRGDPEILREELTRLKLSCHRLIWLNPLLGAPQYEPLTRGAQVMLPIADDFLPIRNLANLEMLIEALNKLEKRNKRQ